MSAIDLSLIENFCKEYRQELLKLAVFGKMPDGRLNPRSTMAHVTVMPGIKDIEQLTTLQFKKLLKPYRKNWDPQADKGQLKPRDLRVRLGQVELEEEPAQYRTTFKGKVMTDGVDLTEHPFEQDFVEGVVAQVGEDIELDLIWNGVHDPAGNDPADVNDGFLKIIADEITATNISVANGNQFNSGAITAGNALDQLKAMYRSMKKAYRSIPVNAYMSYDVYDKYVDDYQATVGPIVYNTQFEQIYLEGSNRLCMLTPVAGLGDSQRVIITPRTNMFVGVDLESDREKVIVRQGNNPKMLPFFVSLACGVHIGS